MVTLQHPAFPDVHCDVAEDRVAEAVAAGWVDTRPQPEPAPVEEHPKTRRHKK